FHVSFIFFYHLFYRYSHHRDLLSFPTRRSSDLVTTLENKDSGKLALSKDVFGLPPRADLLQRYVVWQLAKRQQGTHKTKTYGEVDRKSTRLNSSHVKISYAVFCLKKKNEKE